MTLGQHTWIGVDFAILSPGACRMTLPVAFLQDLANLVQQFVKQKGHVSAKLADRLVGKAGRLAHVVPAAKPIRGHVVCSLCCCLRRGRRRYP